MKYCAMIALFLNFACNANVRFGGKNSSIIAGEKGYLKVDSPTLCVKNGNLNKVERGYLQGNTITFEDAYFTAGLSESFVNGVFHPGENVEVVAGGSPQIGTMHLSQRGEAYDTSDFFMTNPGGVLYKIAVDYGDSFMRGQPLFFGHNDITLKDYTSRFSIGIQNTLNSNIILNGGTLYLQNDLSLGDDATFIGDGQIVFNNRRISLGGTASRWTGNLLWNNALDLQMNSRIELEGVWSFYRDAQINGNSNVLDLAQGGQILVYPDTELRLSGVKIKGLGTGKIIMAPTARICLSDVEIEMNDHVDIYAGSWYIDGATSVITKDKLLTFRSSTPDDSNLVLDDYGYVEWTKGLDTHGSLSIDRVALTYDPLEFVDQYNIRPLRINDPNHKYINIINGGSIRKFRMESISFLDYSSDTALQRYAVVFPVRPVKIFPEVINGVLNYDVNVKGNSNYYRFTEAHQPLMFITDDVHAVYQDMLFSQFSAEYLELGNNASLIFGNNTTVELFRSEDLTYTWTFQGTAHIRGGGAILNLAEHGNIVVAGEGSSLTIQNMTIKGLSRDKIRCLEASSRIIFKDVTLILENDFDWHTGACDVLGDVTISGGYAFAYTSPAQSMIYADSTLLLKHETTFLYNPYGNIPLGALVQDYRELIHLADRSATFAFDSATLSAPAPGMQLINGRLVFTRYNSLFNEGGTNAQTGIVFGNGISENNVLIDMANPYSLSVASGVKIEQLG